jgi:hypothetical protein
MRRAPPQVGLLGGALSALLLAQAPAPPPAPPPVEIHQVSPAEVKGVIGDEVVSPAGESMGRIIDVLVDQEGRPRAAVIDFGGFLGIGNRRIAVDWKSLHFPSSPAPGKVICDLTPDQIKAAPEYREDTARPPAIAAPARAAAPGASSP